MDLFGDTVIAPQCAASVLKKTLISASHGFVTFWEAWPRGPRRVAKQQCLDRWARLGCANNAQHVLAYLEWVKTSPDWQKENGAYIPMPATWLNRQGWIDWEPEKERRKEPDALAIIKSHKGAPQPAAIREQMAALRRRAADKS